jgi:hypothetical protein
MNGEVDRHPWKIRLAIDLATSIPRARRGGSTLRTYPILSAMSAIDRSQAKMLANSTRQAGIGLIAFDALAINLAGM